MCGFVAIIHNQNNHNFSNKHLTSMMATILHRGPDGEGVYISKDNNISFGHRRLSLVDLSSNGKQPMSKHNRTIVFNGEIYNFRKINNRLKELGYTFTSTSDTETILSAFDAWGIDCLQQFNGAFAFVIYDHTTQEIYIVRDRIGEKPLYYMSFSDRMIVASEIKAFLTIPSVKFQPDIDTIKSNLIFHFFSDKEASYFENIKSLRPGHYLHIRHGQITNHTYWDIDISDEKKTYKSTNISRDLTDIRELLHDAIKIRLEADTEIGSLLSGGVDSSLMTAMASSLTTHPLKCFTLSLANHLDEDSKHVHKFLKFIPNIDPITVDINKQTYSIENLDRLTKHLEEAVLNKISLYVNANYNAVHTHGLKAVLNGQGSDEISLGYYFYYDFMHFSEKALRYPAFAHYWYDNFILKDYMKIDNVKNLIEINLSKNYLPYLEKCDDIKNALLAFNIRTHLLNILNHEDRFSMAESVECRTVYTDYRLIEKFMHIPSQDKIYDGREKYHIRKIGENILPKSIIRRLKMGFPNLPDNAEVLTQSICSSNGFKNSHLLHQLFLDSLFSDIYKLPIPIQWKLASIYRFEQVFFQT